MTVGESVPNREEEGKNSLIVSSNILFRLGLFERKRYASLISESRFLTP